MSMRRPRLGALTSIVEVHLKDAPEVMGILEAAEKTIGELRAENTRLRGVLRDFLCGAPAGSMGYRAAVEVVRAKLRRQGIDPEAL